MKPFWVSNGGVEPNPKPFRVSNEEFKPKSKPFRVSGFRRKGGLNQTLNLFGFQTRWFFKLNLKPFRVSNGGV